MGRKRISKRQSNLAENARAVHEGAIAALPPPVTSIADHSLHELAEQAMAGLNALAVAIALDLDGQMTCRARAGTTAPEIGTPVQRDRGITGECVRTAAVVRCDDTHSDPRVDAAVCEQLRIGSILITPLLRNGDVLGVVEAFFILPHSFDDVDVDFLQSVAQQIVARVWSEAQYQSPPAALEVSSAERQLSPEMTPEVVEPSLEPPQRDDVATAPTESQPHNFAIDSSPEPPRRTRNVVPAVAALIVIAIVAVLYARWNRTAAPPASSPTQIHSQPAQAVPPDPLQEVRASAEAGDSSAQYKLARAYKHGEGVPADPQQANAWLLTAAEHGNGNAQWDWARAHESSAPVEAYTWYVIAGQNGKKESDAAIRRLTPKLTPAQIAQVRLDVARQYLAGQALRRDPMAAYVWFRLAEQGGSETAKSELKNLQSRLSSRQLQQAETRASEWIRRHTPPAPPDNPATAPQM